MIAGYFVLEYVPTGRYYIDTARDVHKAAGEHKRKAYDLTHPSKLLNELMRREPDLKVKVFECDSMKDARIGMSRYMEVHGIDLSL